MADDKTTQPSLDSRIDAAVQGLGTEFEIPTLADPGINSDEDADDEGTSTETEGGDDDASSTEESTTTTGDSSATTADQTSDADADTTSESPDVSRLADLAEAEDDIRRSRIQLRNKELELAEREKAVQDAPQPVDINAAIRENPFQALKDAGVPFDHLLDVVTRNQGEIPQTVTTEKPQTPSEISELKEMIGKLEKKIEDRDADDSVEADKLKYKGAINATVKDDKYAVLRTMRGHEDAIFSLALKHAQQTGEALEPSEIADKLQERWKETLKSAAADNSAREAMGLDPLPEGQQPKPKKPKQQKPVESETTETTTLTEEGSRVTRPKRSTKGMSRDEAIFHAAKELKGEDLWGSMDDEEDEETDD